MTWPFLRPPRSYPIPGSSAELDELATSCQDLFNLLLGDNKNGLGYLQDSLLEDNKNDLGYLQDSLLEDNKNDLGYLQDSRP